MSDDHDAVPANTAVSLEDFRAARANGGWRVAAIRCVACGHRMIATGPCGSPLPACTRCNGKCSREVAGATRVDGTPDPQVEHRRFLVGLLEETIAAVAEGHIDGAFLVVHQSETHPGGVAWATAYSGNVDFVHQLGALELAKADLIHRASLVK